jgi:hypothetical protein
MEISKLFNENNLLFSTICQLRAASCNCSQNAMLCRCVCGGKCRLCRGSCKNITQTRARRRSSLQQRSREILRYISVLRRGLHWKCFQFVWSLTSRSNSQQDGRRPREACNKNVDSITNCVTRWQKQYSGASPNWRRRADMRSTIHAPRSVPLNKNAAARQQFCVSHIAFE